MNNKKRNLFHLWEELNRRKVVRVVLVYLAAAYAILESSDIILPRLGLADWTVNLVMVVLFIGLVIVIILSWIYDITPEGIKVTDIKNGKLSMLDRDKLEDTKLGDFIIQEKLGKSTLGIIYSAKDTLLKRKVALVFLAEWICSDKLVRARLIEKIQAAAGIIKENTTTIFSVEKDNDLVFIVLELDKKSKYIKIPADIQGIIVEAIQDEPVQVDDIEEYAASVFKSANEDASIAEDKTDKPVIVRSNIQKSFPVLISSSKATFGAIAIIIVLIISFNWKGINSIINGEAKKRIIAESFLENGKEYFDQANYEAARLEFEKAVEADPGYSVAWSSLAAACINLDMLDDAIMHTIRAIELDKEFKEAAYNLAYALDDKKDYLQAEEWYSRAISIDSTFLPAYSALGRVYNLSGKPVNAIFLLKSAKQKFISSDSLFLIQRNLGYSYYLMEQAEEAIRHLNDALEAQPEDLITIRYLALSYEQANKLSKSMEYWEKYIDTESDSLEIDEAMNNLERISRKYLDNLENK